MLPSEESFEVILDALIAVVRVNAFGPPLAEFLFHATACEFEPGLVEVVTEPVPRSTPDRRRKVLDERLIEAVKFLPCALGAALIARIGDPGLCRPAGPACGFS